MTPKRDIYKKKLSDIEIIYLICSEGKLTIHLSRSKNLINFIKICYKMLAGTSEYKMFYPGLCQHTSIESVNAIKEIGYDISPYPVHFCLLQATVFFGAWTTFYDNRVLHIIWTLILYCLETHGFSNLV